MNLAPQIPIGILSVVCAAFALKAFAYLPPVAERDGIAVRIIGFDEAAGSRELHVVERDSSKPFPVEIQIENKGPTSVKGRLDVWLNDDWDVFDASCCKNSNF